MHACAEYGELEAVKLAVELGADVNARERIDGEGYGNQTPIYHTVTSWQNCAFPVLEWLIERGADLTVKANLRVPPVWFDEERGDAFLEDVTPLE